MDLASAGVVYSTLDVALSRDTEPADDDLPFPDKTRFQSPLAYLRKHPRAVYAALATIALLVLVIGVVAGVTASRTSASGGPAPPSSPTWWSWDHQQSCSPALFLNATSEGDIIAAIKTAKARGLTLKVVGTGHSFSPIDLTGGVMLSLVPPPVSSPDAFTLLPGGGSVRVHAGLPLWQVNEALQGLGLCLPNLGAISMQASHWTRVLGHPRLCVDPSRPFADRGRRRRDQHARDRPGHRGARILRHRGAHLCR